LDIFPNILNFTTVKKIKMKAILHLISISILLMFSNVSYGQENFSRDIKDFYILNVLGNIRVELYQSEIPKLEISIKGLSAENVITEVKGGELKLRLKTGSSNNAVVKIKVYYRSLEEIISASGGLVVSPEIISGGSMAFTARSGGKMELEIELENLKAEVVQGAILVFKGKVKRQEISVNTGATYSAYYLEAEDSYVKASSGGKAKIRASRIIEATANSAGYIGYIGDPASEYTKTNLGGEIVKYKNNEAAGIEE
jgi:hypothetical protein